MALVDDPYNSGAGRFIERLLVDGLVNLNKLEGYQSGPEKSLFSIVDESTQKTRQRITSP